uniref:Uncharacterized protein n=1 Tax=Physcomitrium patens TaxID=3218 RepID=A0A2K1IK02_PHYPA|nr:hypothetical protein PHYPA_028304 [Physcomitrium patens]
MSHSFCGECSELEYRAAGQDHNCVGGDMIGRAHRRFLHRAQLTFNWRCKSIDIKLGRKSPSISALAGALTDVEAAKNIVVAQPGNRTPVSTVGGYYDATTPAAHRRIQYHV